MVSSIPRIALMLIVISVLGMKLVYAIPTAGSTARCIQADGVGLAYRERPVQIEQGDVVLIGRLFIPNTPGPHPAVVVLHGGGRKEPNEGPRFFAPFFARCGIATLVYDKRGTGASGGAWETASFDDFAADAAAAVALLRQQPDVDARQVGLVGLSQGGQLAPTVAVKDDGVAFVVSVSAPFTSVADTRLYAVEQALRRRGLHGADLDTTLAYWKRHFEAVTRGDMTTLKALDREIRTAKRRNLLPPTSAQMARLPVYRSMQSDYTDDLSRLRVPFLAVYGERDARVPVAQSIAVLHRVEAEAGGPDVDVVVVPYANHSFNDLTFNQRIRIEETILAWMLEHTTVPQAPAQPVTTSQ